jgi:hypothetical protein
MRPPLRSVTRHTEYQYPHPLNDGGVPQPPTNISLPIVSGATTQGQTLTGSAGFWTWDPIGTFTYQWRRCDESGNNCTNISGATTTTYTQTAGDIGSTLRVVVNATNAVGGPVAATSVPSGVVTAPGAENRISNPGFEQWSGAKNHDNENTAFWTGWTSNSDFTKPGGAKYIETNTYEWHSGKAAFKIRAHDGMAWVRQNFVPAEPGQQMAISFWFATSTPSAGVTFRIFDRTSDSEVLVHGPIKADGLPRNAWTKYAGTWTVPPGCTSAAIVFTSEAVGQLETMWLDDVVVAPPTPASTDRPSPPRNLRLLQP